MELGFIVVQVDGMTTSFRSKEFEEVCYKNLKDAGLPDHIAWIKAAADKCPRSGRRKQKNQGVSGFAGPGASRKEPAPVC